MNGLSAPFRACMVEIVPFDKEHLVATFRWIQDPELRRGFLFSRNVTPDSHLKWFEELSASQTERIFAIKSNNIHVGNLGLKQIDSANRTAESWIYVGDSTQLGKGISYNAYTILLELLKVEGRHDSIYCHIASFNTASMRLYEKLGFEKELNFQKQITWMDKTYDLLRYKKKL